MSATSPAAARVLSSTVERPLELVVEGLPVAAQLAVAGVVVLLASAVVAFATLRGRRWWRADHSPLDLGLRCLHLTLVGVLPLAFSKYQQDPLYQKAYTIQFLTSLMLALFVVRALVRGAFPVPRSAYLPPILGLVIWAFVSLGWTPVPSLALDDWVNLAMCVAFWVITCVLSACPRYREQMALVAVIGTTGVGVFAIGQYFGYSIGGLVQLVEPDTPEKARMVMASTIGHNLGTSGQAYFGLAFALYLFTHWRGYKARLVLTGVAALHLLVLFRTLSRVYWISTFCAIVLGLCLLLWFRPFSGQTIRPASRRGLVAGAAVIAVVLLALLAVPGQGPGLMERLKDFRWETIRSTTQLRLNVIGLYMLRDSAPLGAGLAGFKYLYPDYQGQYFADHPFSTLRPSDRYSQHVHNDILQLGIELGLPGLFLLGWFGVVHLRLASRLLRVPAGYRLGATVLFLALSGMFVTAAGYFPFHEPPVTLHVLLALGMLSAVLAPTPRLAPTGLFAQPRVRSMVTVVVGCALVLLVLLNTAVRCARILMADANLKVGIQAAQIYGEWLDGTDPARQRAAYRVLRERVDRVLVRAIALQPYRGDVRWTRAQLLTKLMWFELNTKGQFDRALQQQAETILGELERTLVTYRFGECYYIMGQVQALLAYAAGRIHGQAAANELYAQAVQSLERAIRILPRNLAARHFLGNLYWERDLRHEAVQVWESCATDKDYVSRFHEEPFRQAEARGQLVRAESTLHAWRAFEPFNLAPHYELVRFYLDHAGALDPLHEQAHQAADLACERSMTSAWEYGTPAIMLHLRLGEDDLLQRRFWRLWDEAVDETDRGYLIIILGHQAIDQQRVAMAAQLADVAVRRLARRQQLPPVLAVRGRLHWLAGNLVAAFEDYLANSQTLPDERYDRQAARSVLTSLLLAPSLELSL